ncbi:MAG: cellulase family glycosylhydrolase [Lachnospiraceae bacterium]|nr:cellulase family glycosylhydrolase [Lachnospiraceae bacterium]
MGRLKQNVRGVNLGNWLVLEKWMNPAMFSDTEALDEYHLPRMLPEAVYRERIRTHRNEYITERDFTRIASWGFGLVRIPVPFFIFGDVPPFIGCIEELDKAMSWAEAYGLKVLIDLHTAPGCQNGFDNGGMQNILTFGQDPADVEFVYTVLERLSERYGKRQGLFGIEILNEPMVRAAYEMMHMAERRGETNDPELAAKSEPLTMEFLRSFYDTAYDRMRAFLPEDKAVVIHDAFLLDAWKDFWQDGDHKNVILDTHQYLMMIERPGEGPAGEERYREFLEDVGSRIEEMEKYFPVVTGEWCLSNGAVTRMEDPEERKAFYRFLSDLEIREWNRGSGYIYWSYKLLIDTVNGGAKFTDAWDLGRCRDFGWFTD